MARICYAVVATLPDNQIADEYVRWLEDGHVDQVLNAGAHSAMIVRLDRAADDGLGPAERQIMTQYIFSTREVFDRYVSVHAPALRADGVKRFGGVQGVRFERRLGEIV